MGDDPAKCELCAGNGGAVLWRDRRCRVVLVADADYAGFCRVIWNEHVREMTDLTDDEQSHCMRVVFAVERALRNVLDPHKINLGSFGNMTPHVHWHVIPRSEDDPHFPESIWGKKQRNRATGITANADSTLEERLKFEIARLL